MLTSHESKGVAAAGPATAHIAEAMNATEPSRFMATTHHEMLPGFQDQ